MRHLTREAVRLLDKRDVVRVIARSGKVFTLRASGNPQLQGDVVIAAGTGATVTQSGQTITITAT